MIRMHLARLRRSLPLLLLIAAAAIVPTAAPLGGQEPATAPAPASPAAQDAPAHRPGGEVNLVIPDLDQQEFWGVGGRTLLMFGLIVCALGLLFGLVIYGQLKRLPVHSSMLEISELIYETCKTYLITQGKFILLLEIGRAHV